MQNKSKDQEVHISSARSLAQMIKYHSEDIRMQGNQKLHMWPTSRRSKYTVKKHYEQSCYVNGLIDNLYYYFQSVGHLC